MARGEKLIAENRRARHDYHILERVEAGLVLTGTEVKSLRDGGGNLRDSFATLHAREIDALGRKVAERGNTIVPLAMYFKNGRVKVELGLAKGKERADKRHAIAERDAQRQVERALRDRERARR